MRDYRKEYLRDHSSDDAKKKRAMRNLWNRRLKGKVPEGKEIDHRHPLKNGGSNDRSNIRFRSVSENRGDKSMFKTAVLGAMIGGAAADDGVENRAKGAIAGETAGWLATPVGGLLGAEYVRRNAKKMEATSLEGKSFGKMVKNFATSPIKTTKGLGPKGALAVTAGTFATSIPASYIAGKYFGSNNPPSNSSAPTPESDMPKESSYITSDDYFQKSAGAIAGAIGVYAADDGVKNKARGAAAGAVASWVVAPVGAIAGMEYLRARAKHYKLEEELKGSRGKMYKRLLTKPVKTVKGLGTKGNAIVVGSTMAVGYPAAYFAGKHYGSKNYGKHEKRAGLDPMTLQRLQRIESVIDDPRFQSVAAAAESQTPDKWKDVAKEKTFKGLKNVYTHTKRTGKKIRSTFER